MRSIAAVVALVVTLVSPAFAQKADIEAVNAKWIEFFNKGDFAGVASLYAEDATAFPPGSGMVKGRAAIEALWKSMAEQVSDPKLTKVRGRRRSAASISWCGRRSETTGSSRPISGTTASRHAFLTPLLQCLRKSRHRADIAKDQVWHEREVFPCPLCRRSWSISGRNVDVAEIDAIDPKRSWGAFTRLAYWP
jgi:ketosteroid isomerase-like protein